MRFLSREFPLLVVDSTSASGRDSRPGLPFGYSIIDAGLNIQSTAIGGTSGTEFKIRLGVEGTSMIIDDDITLPGGIYSARARFDAPGGLRPFSGGALFFEWENIDWVDFAWSIHAMLWVRGYRR